MSHQWKNYLALMKVVTLFFIQQNHFRLYAPFAMHLEYYEVLPKTSSLFLQTIAITHHLVNLVTIPSEEACFSMLKGDYGTKGRKIQPNTEKFLEKTE